MQLATQLLLRPFLDMKMRTDCINQIYKKTGYEKCKCRNTTRYEVKNTHTLKYTNKYNPAPLVSTGISKDRHLAYNSE